MADSTNTTNASDKPFGISQIRAYITIVLNMDKMNYDVWRELFETHCLTFGVLGHLDGTSNATPTTEKIWKERDGLVKMWIYGTITDSLVETILKPKATARDLWTALENQFRDNKENRALQLENELRTITIGDLSVHEYCRKLKSLSDLLTNVDAPVSDRALVMHCLNGLNDKFDGIHNVIRHRTPFPTFDIVRSMLQAEEDRLKQHQRTTITHTSSASSPTVLYAGDSSPSAPSTQTYNNNNNNNYRGNNKYRGRGGGRGNRGRGRFHNSGHHAGISNTNSYGYPSWPFVPPQWPYPYYHGGFPMIPSPPAHTAHAPTPRQNSILGPYTPRHPHEAHMVQHENAVQPTVLPSALAHAFNTMSLQEPANAS
ncbi:hypothetical protein CARUB_v10028228mg, partial [Capsella rubella]